MGKNDIGNHIIKVCAAELTFKIFTWKSHFHNQYYLKDRHAYTKLWNEKTRRHTQNCFPILGSSSFLVSTTKYLVFYFLWSPSLSSEWVTFWFQQEIFEIKNNQRKTIFLSSSLFSPKLSLFLSSLFSFNVTKMTIFQRWVILREKSLMGLLDSLWKAC